MPARYVIGMDCSTTATKAVVWDSKATRWPRAGPPSHSSPQPGWGEQNAEDWWRSTRDALRQAAGAVDADEIGAIEITIQRETFVCLDEHNRPIRPAILWLDSRAGPSGQVRLGQGPRDHRQAAQPDSGFYKMLWLRENEPGPWIGAQGRRARVSGPPDDQPVENLLGHGRPLGLVDMRTFDWSDELLGMVGLTREHMAEINPPGEILGELADEVAAEVGIPAGIRSLPGR